jgi:catechol 2,3-dioxygenase-like lactoylglutathione lyase family enzyme
MKARITIITLGVDDLQTAVAFYRDGLGWKTPGIIGTELEHGAVAFFDLPSGMKLALWPRDSIAHDAGLAKGPRSSTEFTLAHNLNSAADVDAAMACARHAGAKIIKEARKTFFGGYAGYFADPDGHVWEVIWNPQIEVRD